MTLVAAWVRRTPGGEELIVSSDSRVTGGITLNHAPKIFRLERNDAVLAYCGPTLVAYPLILQIKAALDGYEESRNRVIDIVHLKSHIEKTIERLRQQVGDLPSKDNTNRKFQFLLGGYSWKTSCFCVWTFRYDVATGEFNAFSMPRTKRFVFMSDSQKTERRAKDELVRRVFRGKGTRAKPLDWEPLKVLLEVIDDEAAADVGGPPQIVKVYKHANTLPINVIWPESHMSNGITTRLFGITHLGRPLLGYERSRYLTLDPETWDLVEPWKIQARLKIRNDREEARLRLTGQQAVAKCISQVRDRKSLQARLTEMIAKSCAFDELSRAMRSS